LKANIDRRRVGDGCFWISNSSVLERDLAVHQGRASSFQTMEPEQRDPHAYANAVPYSIGRARRWEQIDEFMSDDTLAVHVSSEGIVPRGVEAHQYTLRARQDHDIGSGKRSKQRRRQKERKRQQREVVRTRKGASMLSARRRRRIVAAEQAGVVDHARLNDNRKALHVFVFRPSRLFSAPSLPVKFASWRHVRYRGHHEGIASSRRCAERSRMANVARFADFRPNEKPTLEKRLQRRASERSKGQPRF